MEEERENTTHIQRELENTRQSRERKNSCVPVDGYPVSYSRFCFLSLNSIGIQTSFQYISP